MATSLEQGWCSSDAVASHHCDPGSIPGLGFICGLSLWISQSLISGSV